MTQRRTNFSCFRELILFYMVNTRFTSFHAIIEYRQMINLNGNSTYMIVKVFQWQLWNTRIALQICPKAELYQTVQIQRKIWDQVESPVVRCGGLIWVRQITAWSRLDGVSKTVWIGLYYRHLILYCIASGHRRTTISDGICTNVLDIFVRR